MIYSSYDNVIRGGINHENMIFLKIILLRTSIEKTWKTFAIEGRYFFYGLETGKILECFLDEYKMLKDLPSLKDLNQLESLFSKYENEKYST